MKNRICTKFALCKPVANINFAKVCTRCISSGCQVCTECANLATTTFAMGANLYKFNICNRFAQGKLCANSIFHPVIVAQPCQSVGFAIDLHSQKRHRLVASCQFYWLNYCNLSTNCNNIFYSIKL